MMCKSSDNVRHPVTETFSTLHYTSTQLHLLTLHYLAFNPKATNVIYIYMEHQFLMFLDHTQRRTTVGRTPLDE